MMYDRGPSDAGGGYAIAMTPMAWVAYAFSHWRGDIIYRFKIICTKFHQGRVRISWDPINPLSTTADVSNATLTKIVDLSVDTEVEFRVPYMQALSWSAHTLTSGVASSNNWSTTASPTPLANVHNGFLTVRCLTNLSAPVDTAPVYIQVFVRGAPNLQFANPVDIDRKLSYIQMQGKTDEVPGPVSISNDDDRQYLTNWGEPVSSIRLLLRRSTLVDVQSFDGAGTTDLLGEFRIYQTRYPPPPGYDPNGYGKAKGVIVPATTFNYNFTSMNYYSYFAPAFFAQRGAMRWHYNVINSGASDNTSYGVIRMPQRTLSAGNNSYVTLVANTSTNNSLAAGSFANNARSWGNSGLALTNGKTQTGMSAEMPMLTSYRFQSTNPLDLTLGTSNDGSDRDCYYFFLRVSPKVDGTLNPKYVERYCSIGTDFNLYMFLSVPPLYYNGSSGGNPQA
jgi:hypothetical protein